MEKSSRHIVVLGAGFAGLEFCKRLAGEGARITLVDRQNHHLFQPLLYQVATAGLSAPDIAEPIRAILARDAETRVVLDEVLGVDLGRRRVRLTQHTLEYDYLVIALGGVTNYFGHPEWARFAPGLKSLDDALHIRRNVLLAFERAESSENDAERRRLTTVVVVGGGPTGVELAGAFAELCRVVLKRDFRRVDPGATRVVLLEAGPRLLAHLPPKLSANGADRLQRLGVEVRTGATVRDIQPELVELTDGTVIPAANIIWAAGVSASPLTRDLGVETDRAGRLKVLPDLSLPGHSEVFAVGDLALVLDDSGRPVPGVSPAAMQMARHVARIIRGDLRAAGPGARADARARPPFRYRDKGTMATIGRSAAVAKIGALEITGWPAWLAWLLVHLIFLIGFDNKLGVLLQWCYSYLTWKRGARLITGLSDVPAANREATPRNAGA